VQYTPATDTTVVGALTNSGIEVGNRNRSQNQALQAGQLAVVVRNRITRIAQFDLRTFYETNELVQGLELSQETPGDRSDPALAAVRAETLAALQRQAKLPAVSAGKLDSIWQGVLISPERSLP
jgi:ABC-type amino acid transport substrate-binding protein